MDKYELDLYQRVYLFVPFEMESLGLGNAASVLYSWSLDHCLEGQAT